MDIKDKLLCAMSVPVVPIFAQLMAGIRMAGCQIIPQDLWQGLGQILSEQSEAGEGPFQIPGWESLENHLRSETHDTWQYFALEYLQTNKPRGHEVWVIPVQELICLHQDDEEAMDFVDCERLVFVGDEKAMRASLKAFNL